MQITDEMVEKAARAMCEAWHYAPIGTPDGNEEWKRKQDQYRKQARAALNAAQAVVVKPLEWEQPYPDEWRAEAASFEVYYKITAVFGGWHAAFWGTAIGLPTSTLEAAQAAAQADYEARILSALVSTPPDLAEPRPDVVVYDPGTGFLHADDGGAPDHGERFVPLARYDDLAERVFELTDDMVVAAMEYVPGCDHDDMVDAIEAALRVKAENIRRAARAMEGKSEHHPANEEASDG